MHKVGNIRREVERRTSLSRGNLREINILHDTVYTRDSVWWGYKTVPQGTNPRYHHPTEEADHVDEGYWTFDIDPDKLRDKR